LGRMWKNTSGIGRAEGGSANYPKMNQNYSNDFLSCLIFGRLGFQQVYAFARILSQAS
jgi:hypothetical protein